MAISELCPANKEKCNYRVHLNRILANLEVTSSELEVGKMSKRAKAAVQSHLDGIATAIDNADKSEVATACNFIGMCGIIADLTAIEMVRNDDLDIHPTANLKFNGEF